MNEMFGGFCSFFYERGRSSEGDRFYILYIILFSSGEVRFEPI